MGTGTVSDDSINARVSSQWLVKKNTVFQQIVVTNTGSSSIDNFTVQAKQHMLIRDLDYLTSRSHFNDKWTGDYIRGQGPNGFSWVTANVFDSGKAAMSEEGDARSEHATHAGEVDHQEGAAQSPGVTEEISENKRPVSPPKPSSDEYIRPHKTSSQERLEHDLPPGDTQSTVVIDACIDQQHHSTKERKTAEQPEGNPPKEAKPTLTDKELWQKRRIEDTWSTKEAHAVASIMTLYVNGVAEKMEKRARPILRSIGHAGSSSSVLEITVAYRMIVIPKDKVHWENFIIPAETADVSAMLAAETRQVWGHSSTDECKCGRSLCDLGLSVVEMEEQKVKQDARGRGQTAHNPGIAKDGAQRSKAAPDDTITMPTPQMEANKGETLTAAETDRMRQASQNTSETPVTGAAVRMSQKLPPINQIEYLTWRHTEHILSVCTIPLSVPILSLDEVSGPNSPEKKVVTTNFDALGTAEGEEIEPEVPLALTCGDMSGHRVCTSASL